MTFSLYRNKLLGGMIINDHENEVKHLRSIKYLSGYIIPITGMPGTLFSNVLHKGNTQTTGDVF